MGACHGQGGGAGRLCSGSLSFAHRDFGSGPADAARSFSVNNGNLMCGIFGIWHADGRAVDLASVQRAVTSLRHRGPDDEGYLLVNTRTSRVVECGGKHTDERLGLPGIEEFFAETFDLVLGHRRLAILDLSPTGHQPMATSDNAVWIVHNGEVYNYLELRSELKSHGHEFHTDSDTEVILAAYEQWGPACLTRFNGMWSFVLYDACRRSLFCVRDRFGIKPLHYAFQNGTFVFASEIKALLCMGAGERTPDSAAIFDYLVWGLVNHSQHTFFEGIDSLAPACYLMLQDGQLGLHSFWDLEQAAEEYDVRGWDDRRIARQFRELLTDAVRLNLRSDVPVGTCLSGGVDSSSIVCVANRLMFGEERLPIQSVGDPQKTFTACFDDPRIDERHYVELVVKATGAESHSTFPRPERLFETMPRLMWHQEEPFGSTSIYAQWLVMDLANQHGFTVLLDGQGADEMLAGYPGAWSVYLGALLRTGCWLTLWREAKQHRAINLGERGQLAGLRRAVLSALPAQLKNSLKVVWGDRWPTWLNQEFVQAHSKRSGLPHQADGSLRSFLLGQMAYHLPALLRYEDRNSMAFGLEARAPFLDYRLVSFVFALQDGQRIFRGLSKAVLRRAMKGIVPEVILNRRDKIGFATPEEAWFRGPLWPRIEETLSSDDFRSLPFFNHTKVHDVLGLYQRGYLEISDTLWRWVNLAIWMQTFFAKRHHE
ncbi:MAG: asparagine synthase (glutamine-hydrolyzing) [candidate division NC10 bacterium]|nr:asparagine synthase (glutamine-hydrolyzing) [candidate division NC10 bacterium]